MYSRWTRSACRNLCYPSTSGEGIAPNRKSSRLQGRESGGTSMSNYSSRWRLAAAASPLALALSLAGAPAAAQTTEPVDPAATAATQDAPVDEQADEATPSDGTIIVTGYRAALQNSINTKKRSEL